MSHEIDEQSNRRSVNGESVESATKCPRDLPPRIQIWGKDNQSEYETNRPTHNAYYNGYSPNDGRISENPELYKHRYNFTPEHMSHRNEQSGAFDQRCKGPQRINSPESSLPSMPASEYRTSYSIRNVNAGTYSSNGEPRIERPLDYNNPIDDDSRIHYHLTPESLRRKIVNESDPRSDEISTQDFAAKLSLLNPGLPVVDRLKSARPAVPSPMSEFGAAHHIQDGNTTYASKGRSMMHDKPLYDETIGGASQKDYLHLTPESGLTEQLSERKSTQDSIAKMDSLDIGRSWTDRSRDSTRHHLDPKQGKYRDIWNECVPVSFELNSDAKRQASHPNTFSEQNRNHRGETLESTEPLFGNDGAARKFDTGEGTNSGKGLSPPIATKTLYPTKNEEQFCGKLKLLADSLKKEFDTSNDNDHHTPLHSQNHQSVLAEEHPPNEEQRLCERLRHLADSLKNTTKEFESSNLETPRHTQNHELLSGDNADESNAVRRPDPTPPSSHDSYQKSDIVKPDPSSDTLSVSFQKSRLSPKSSHRPTPYSPSRARKPIEPAGIKNNGYQSPQDPNDSKESRQEAREPVTSKRLRSDPPEREPADSLDAIHQPPEYHYDSTTKNTDNQKEPREPNHHDMPRVGCLTDPPEQDELQGIAADPELSIGYKSVYRHGISTHRHSPKHLTSPQNRISTPSKKDPRKISSVSPTFSPKTFSFGHENTTPQHTSKYLSSQKRIKNPSMTVPESMSPSFSPKTYSPGHYGTMSQYTGKYLSSSQKRTTTPSKKVSLSMSPTFSPKTYSSQTTSPNKISHLRTPKSKTSSIYRKNQSARKSESHTRTPTKSEFHLNIPSWVDEEIDTPLKPVKSFGEGSMDQLMKKIEEIENDFSTVVASLPGSEGGLTLRFSQTDDNSTLASKTTFDLQEETDHIEHQLASSSFETYSSQDNIMNGILQQMRSVQNQIERLDSNEPDDGSEKSQESQGMAELLERLANAAESLRSLQVE